MAYYYVKNGGTATGDTGRYASQQTGSFAALGAANYYNDIAGAIAATTSPASGDFVIVSDLSVNTTGLSLTGIASNPFFVVSVDDANVNQARTNGNRAELNGGTNADIILTNQFVSGLFLNVGDDIIISGGTKIIDCEMRAFDASDRILSALSDGNSIIIESTILSMDHITVTAAIAGGSSVIANNITLQTTTGGVTNFFSGGFDNGGGYVDIRNSDLSAITGTLFHNIGADVAVDDKINITLDMCKIAVGVAFANETFKSHNQRLLATRCSSSSAAAEYQYYLHAFAGNVDDDSAIYRNEDEAFTESNQKISYKIVTNTDATLGSPLWLDFPVNRYSRLSNTATDTLRFYLTSNETLTNKDIYIEVGYPDGTNKQTANFASSAPQTVGSSIDLMATGTTLTTDTTSTWTGGLANKYQIDVSTASDVGADCQPIVKVYVTKPSITIQLASEYGLV